MKYNATKFTNEEKVKLVMGKNLWSNEDFNGKIGMFTLSDASVGVRKPVDPSDWGQNEINKSIAYPCFQVVAQTWNEDLAKRMGNCIADDCIDLDVDVILGPGVNIKRNPLCGRNFEYLSEDPVLAGTLAKNYILGVQERNIGTCLKHYCCNNYEYCRNWLSSEVDERTLREIYLKSFEIALEAKPWAIMCAYNSVNGVRMSENERLYNVARDEFGFNGLIMSDWDAVKNPLASLHAGLDLEMPYHKEHAEIMQKHLLNGEIDLEKLAVSTQRVLDLVEKSEESQKTRKASLTKEERLKIAQEIEEEGIVLAKNNDNVLPLKKDDTVLVTGAPAVRDYYQGGGSSKVLPTKQYITLETALKECGVECKFEETISHTIANVSSVCNYKVAVRDALERDVVIATVGNPSNCEYESADRTSLRLSEQEYDMVRFMRKYAKKLVLLVYAGSVVDIAELYDICDAILFVGFGGEQASYAIANVLTGKVNPSGRLAETYAYELDDYPSQHTYYDESVWCYEDGLNVGYRYFTTRNIPTLFPFGFGLSYSEINYNEVRITEHKGNRFELEVELENLSDMDAKEVVQVYVSELTKVVYRPAVELKAFKKVLVPAHSKVVAKLELDEKAFMYYSTELSKWTYHPGYFKIKVGADAETMLFEKTVEIR